MHLLQSTCSLFSTEGKHFSPIDKPQKGLVNSVERGGGAWGVDWWLRIITVQGHRVYLPIGRRGPRQTVISHPDFNAHPRPTPRLASIHLVLYIYLGAGSLVGSRLTGCRNTASVERGQYVSRHWRDWLRVMSIAAVASDPLSANSGTS